MGTGSLRRIAALTLLATIAVLAGAAASVPAQISVPSTTVTTPTVTVPSTTVRVPSTTTTVTTPQLSTPKPAVKAPAVKAPAVKAPAPKPAVKAPTVKNLAPKPAAGVSDPVKSITNTVSGAPSTGSAGGTVKQTLGAVSGAAGTSSGDVAARTIGGAASTAGGMTYFSNPAGGGGGGTTGVPGGFGAGSAGAGGGGSLATMLAGASSKELRLVLQQLEGCLSALPAADRRVISLRAGLAGAPLSRAQVGQRVGMSPKGVRRTERRALNRLQFAAANTGCAASVVGPFDPAGIGNLSPQVVLAGAVPVNSASATNNFAQARGIIGQSASPLFALGSGGQGGPAWAIILFTVLLSVSVAALTREVRHSF